MVSVSDKACENLAEIIAFVSLIYSLRVNQNAQKICFKSAFFNWNMHNKLKISRHTFFQAPGGYLTYTTSERNETVTLRPVD